MQFYHARKIDAAVRRLRKLVGPTARARTHRGWYYAGSSKSPQPPRRFGCSHSATSQISASSRVIVLVRLDDFALAAHALVCYPNHRIEACDCAPTIWFWAPHICAELKTAAVNLRWYFFGSIKSPRHVNSFTAPCALPVHNVVAEGTRYDPTCKAHTHVADD